MAKRPGTRSEADDSGTGAPAPPRARRSRATPAPQTAGTQAAVNATAGAPVPIGAAGSGHPLHLDPEPAMRAFHADQSLSTWQPSEDEIRLRAYQRYLERGGGHGRACDDWLEAERELKLRG